MKREQRTAKRTAGKEAWHCALRGFTRCDERFRLPAASRPLPVFDRPFHLRFGEFWIKSQPVWTYSFGHQAGNHVRPHARQTEILRLIQRTVAETGMPPTRAEIAAELGFRSANAAEEHLRALARKGVIALIPGTSRGIQLKDTMREQLGLPLIGRVAAGRPILAEENIEGRYQIDPDLFQPKPHYLLKVVGMSMKDVGILDGDLVAVHRTPEVRNRQIVVARLENEVTVKRYRQEGSIAWLLPENADTDPCRPETGHMIIEGIVVGVVRRGKVS